MQRLGTVTTRIKTSGEVVDVCPSAAKHQRRRWCFDVENSSERRSLVRSRDDVRGLGDRRTFTLGHDFAGDLNPLWILQVAPAILMMRFGMVAENITV